MPRHGKATNLLIGAYNVSQWMNSISTTETIDTAETTPFQVNDKTYILGLPDAKVDFGGRFEQATAAQVTAGNPMIGNIIVGQIQTQAMSAVIMASWGVGINPGDYCEYGTELVTSWQVTSPVAGLVTVSGSSQISNGLAHGIQLLAETTVTATTTGTAQSFALPVGIGPGQATWQVAFIVEVMTATSVTMKVQTSADGVTWVDLAGASQLFTAIGSVSLEGLSVPAGAYVRAVETVVGTGNVRALAAFGLD